MSWKKDEGLARASYPLSTVSEVLHNIFNCQLTVDDLAKIPVPEVPHFGPKDYRHRMRRDYVVMPAGVGLVEIWKKIKLLSGLRLVVDEAFLQKIETGASDRRREESYIIRFMSKGDAQDMMNVTTEQMFAGNKPTMRLSELLMAFICNLYIKKVFLPTMNQSTVCPESYHPEILEFRTYPCVSFDSGHYVVIEDGGKVAKKSLSLSYPPPKPNTRDGEMVLWPELKIRMIPKISLSTMFRPREVLTWKEPTK
jgi:hypothetical protein